MIEILPDSKNRKWLNPKSASPIRNRAGIQAPDPRNLPSSQPELLPDARNKEFEK
jgi:hypothetical protein